MSDRDPLWLRIGRWNNKAWSDRTTKIVVVAVMVVGYPAAIAAGALASSSGFSNSPWPGAIGAAIGLPIAWALNRSR